MIQNATLHFLEQLKQHNEKPWFDAHKEEYLTAKENFEATVQQIIDGFGKIEPGIGELQAKKCVFRIYRDVRFSKDKTPYKVHLAATIRVGGRKVHYPGYYLHVEPGGLNYAGGGIWRPESAALAKIRQEIDYNPDEFIEIITHPDFKKILGKLDDDDTLVRAPKGYFDENPMIKYLKLKSFLAGRSFEDKEVTDSEFVPKVVETYATLKPLIDFLGRALDG